MILSLWNQVFCDLIYVAVLGVWDNDFGLFFPVKIEPQRRRGRREFSVIAHIAKHSMDDTNMILFPIKRWPSFVII
jgi:hypothetical protein